MRTMRLFMIGIKKLLVDVTEGIVTEGEKFQKIIIFMLRLKPNLFCTINRYNCFKAPDKFS